MFIRVIAGARYEGMEGNKPVSKGITPMGGVATSSNCLNTMIDAITVDAEVTLILKHLSKTSPVPTAQKRHYKIALLQKPSYFHRNS